MEKIKKLFALCQATVYITYNDHKNSYETIEERVRALDDYDDVGKEMVDEMTKRESMVEIQFYLHTPVGFYKVYHYDIEQAVEEALSIAEKEA